MKGNLFIRYLQGDWFHYYDKPDRGLMKLDDNHYIAPEGRRVISPLTLVFDHKIKVEPRKSIFDKSKGDNV